MLGESEENGKIIYEVESNSECTFMFPHNVILVWFIDLEIRCFFSPISFLCVMNGWNLIKTERL